MLPNALISAIAPAALAPLNSAAGSGQKIGRFARVPAAPGVIAITDGMAKSARYSTQGRGSQSAKPPRCARLDPWFDRNDAQEQKPLTANAQPAPWDSFFACNHFKAVALTSTGSVARSADLAEAIQGPSCICGQNLNIRLP
jgi:hypothetical protein